MLKKSSATVDDFFLLCYNTLVAVCLYVDF